MERRSISQENIMYRHCGKKVAYETRTHARNIAISMRYDGLAVSHYRCVFCRLFHVGKAPQMRNLKELAWCARRYQIDPPNKM